MRHMGMKPEREKKYETLSKTYSAELNEISTRKKNVQKFNQQKNIISIIDDFSRSSFVTAVALGNTT